MASTTANQPATLSVEIDSERPSDSLRACVALLNVPVIPTRFATKDGEDRGAFGEVFQGYRQSGDTESLLAIKVRRRMGAREPIDTECMRLLKELRAWAPLQHPNILPLLGVDFPEGYRMCFVAGWMENGSLRKYFSTHAEADALQVIGGIGRGLAYLHSQDIVHGDVRGDNIVLDDDLQPRLIDFGLARELSMLPALTTSSLNARNLRYLAPERLNPQAFGLTSTVQTITFGFDMYALGMVIYALFTDQPPFHDRNHLEMVGFSNQIIQGARPALPAQTRAGITLPIWHFVQRCWAGQSTQRPAAAELEEVWQSALSQTKEIRQEYQQLALALKAECQTFEKVQEGLGDMRRTIAQSLV